MEEEGVARLGVRFKPEQYDQLRQAAAKAGYTKLADFVRDAVGQVVEGLLQETWSEGPKHGGYRPPVAKK